MRGPAASGSPEPCQHLTPRPTFSITRYGQKAARWRSPRFVSQVATAAPAPTVTVTLSDVPAAGLSTDTYPFNYAGIGGANCTELDGRSGEGTCAWAALKLRR